VLLIAGVIFKNGKRELHRSFMTTAVALSIAFCNVRHHMTADSTKFGGDGVIKYVYYFILVTHIVLSIIIIPLVLITYVRAWRKSLIK
jgi:putative membrane protein